MDTMPVDNGMESPFGGVSDDPNLAMDTQMAPTQNPEQTFDTNFDAGVEANEEEDPKKYIQQLTGKLSQSLRKYNESLPQPDAELSKYVAGMIIKQTVEGLPQEDVTDILDKVKKDDEENSFSEEQPNNDLEGQETPMEDNLNPQMDVPPMNETTGSTLNFTADDDKKAAKQIRKGGYSRKPYRTTI